ncbi:hypothetical protein LMH87_009388 [Akanthomyces muscarius]|uniref:Rhodopsin domain-containing protein n=1 Tax=Akanthomyces muscarius TaxID=2231603 RepID=A0A9W8QB94_AKAMU|nr:hypothetical protein LMH87_009388 [Akanthomyces muscarius]KAJ4152868.1 hypothetical protein LMH87_009388 [Akanthomyces muscarius]
MDSPGGNHEPWWAGRARYWKTTLLATSLTFAILATIFYALRVYASRKSRRIVRPDDIFMGLAVVFMWAETAAVLLKCYNGVGTPAPELAHDRIYRLSLGSWLVAKFCVLSMVCCRLSIILFFRTVFGVYDTTRRILNFLAVFSVVWGIASLCVSIWACSPVTYYWDKSTPGGWCVAPKVYNHESLAFSVLGLLTDLAILATPQQRIWRSQIDLQHKKAITAILGVGIIVCIFSLLRCVQFAYFDTAHLSTSGNLETTWTFLENDISIICGCMPQLRPLLPGYLKGRAPSYAEDGNRVRYDGNNTGIFTWGKRVRGVETTISSNTVFSTRSQHKARNSSELELNAIEVETETTVTRSPDHEAQR